MTFASPEFLWGLTALAIPIAVHLLHLRRYRKEYFSNVDRLYAIQTKNRRHDRLRQRLLLATRLLSITLLVLAFARPLVGDNDNTLDGASVCIYTDNTMSMQRHASDVELKDLATMRASEIMSAYSLDTRFQLHTSALEGSEQRWLTPEEMTDEMEYTDYSASAPMLSDVIAAQRRFLTESGADICHGYIISDFQQSTTDLYNLISDSTTNITLVPLGGDDIDNVYIDTVILDAPAYYLGSGVDVEVQIRNDGGHDAEGVPLRLLVGGHERAMTTINVPAGGVAKATLHFTVKDDGWNDVTVSIDDYPVVFDDTYHLCFYAGSHPRAVEISTGAPNLYLSRIFAGDTLIKYTTATSIPQLSDYDFVVLNDMAVLPTGEALRLAEWIDGGGTLLLVPPAACGNLESLNSFLSTTGAPQLKQWVKRSVRASEVDLHNSLYRGVFNGAPSDMEMPRTEGHYTLLTSSSTRQTVIRLSDGDDMLCVSHYGNGSIYIFTTPLETQWTDLVSQTLFVPTIYNMALFSNPIPASSHIIGDNTPIAIHGNYNPDLAPPHLTNGDSYDCIPGLRRVGNHWALVAYTKIPTAGFYLLGDQHIAFNHSRAESRMSCYNMHDLGDAIEGIQGLSLLDGNHANLGTSLQEQHSGGQGLWRLCLVLMLVALGTETAIARLMKSKP